MYDSPSPAILGHSQSPPAFAVTSDSAWPVLKQMKYPSARFRYATYPEIEWGRIEVQSIHWSSAPVEGGAYRSSSCYMC